MRVTIEVEPMTINEIYERTATASGINPDKVAMYDCTKVRVATNIMQAVIEWYKAQSSDYKMAFAMHWLCYGAKEDDTLEDGTVEYDDGFFEMSKED